MGPFYKLDLVIDELEMRSNIIGDVASNPDMAKIAALLKEAREDVKSLSYLRRPTATPHHDGEDRLDLPHDWKRDSGGGFTLEAESSGDPSSKAYACVAYASELGYWLGHSVLNGEMIFVGEFLERYEAMGASEEALLRSWRVRGPVRR